MTVEIVFFLLADYVLTLGDYLFSKDIHITKKTGYHDFNTRWLTKKKTVYVYLLIVSLYMYILTTDICRFCIRYMNIHRESCELTQMFHSKSALASVSQDSLASVSQESLASISIDSLDGVGCWADLLPLQLLSNQVLSLPLSLSSGLVKFQFLGLSGWSLQRLTHPIESEYCPTSFPTVYLKVPYK